VTGRLLAGQVVGAVDRGVRVRLLREGALTTIADGTFSSGSA
jgi:hypothetical protein